MVQRFFAFLSTAISFGDGYIQSTASYKTLKLTSGTGTTRRTLLSKKLKDDSGDRFLATRWGDRIVLISLHDDPIKNLEELGKKITSKSIMGLRTEILKMVYNDIPR